MKIFSAVCGLFTLFVVSSSSAMTFDQLAKLNPDSYQVIDCRDSNVFNGWSSGQYSRGGHFPHAVNIDSNWLPLLHNEDKFSDLLKNHALKANLPTYLYCPADKENTLLVHLKKQHFSDVHKLQQSINDYSGKLVSLPNYQQLVPVWWVEKLLKGESVNHPPSKDYKIIEVAWGEPTWYLTSHIPGALYLNTDDIESKPLWNKVSDSKIKTVLQQHGVTHNTTILLYGRDMSSAARAANIMMYAGVKDVRLINGGWKAWESAKYPIESLKINHAKPAEFGAVIPQHPEYITDLTQAKTLLKDREHSSLVSIRSWPEFIGKTSGYSYIKPKGRIKGARWGHAGTDSNHLQDFHNPDGTMIRAC